jgi:hypothetical protein
MPEPLALFRPVGLGEMARILQDGRFPPRRPEQPIFYPVLTLDYARQIARDWNAPSESCGHAGYVVRFLLDPLFASQFPERVVGSRIHRELWIPSERLDELNLRLVGPIETLEAHFGPRFAGWPSDSALLRGKNAHDQFLALASLRYTPSELALEIRASSLAVRLHRLFWQSRDYASHGLSENLKLSILRQIDGLLNAST